MSVWTDLVDAERGLAPPAGEDLASGAAREAFHPQGGLVALDVEVHAVEEVHLLLGHLGWGV